jgi:hypothetical protein
MVQAETTEVDGYGIFYGIRQIVMNNSGYKYEFSKNDLEKWVGKPVLDEDGSEIGKIVSVYESDRGIIGVSKLYDGTNFEFLLEIPGLW